MTVLPNAKPSEPWADMTELASGRQLWRLRRPPAWPRQVWS